MDHPIGAGLIFDDSVHYVDHLAPFCALMNWPLIVCEPSVFALAKRYYPDLQLIQTDLWEKKFPSNLVLCSPLPLFEQTFPSIPTSHCTFFWLPHGNSDKGWKASFFEGMLQKEIALVYGQKMLDLMHAKQVFPRHIRIGNFRHRYFLLHQEFYTQIIQEEILSQLTPNRPNVLYAPTWDDAENNNSFWKSFPILAESLDPSCNLIVKLHPNTLSRYAPEIERMKGTYQKSKNLLFLEDFSPIYALLSITDVYLGDMSSIGYDFLTMDRPMLFLNPNKRDSKKDPGLSLFSCGKEIAPHELNLENPDPALSSRRQKMGQLTFEPISNWADVAQAIEAYCNSSSHSGPL